MEGEQRDKQIPVFRLDGRRNKMEFIRGFKQVADHFGITRVKEMFKDGIIQRSSSPYNAPILMARKRMDRSDFVLIFGNLTRLQRCANTR